MLNSFRFPSVFSPETRGFIVDKDHRWDFRGGRNDFALWARVYETYGDGNCQHSADVSCSVDLMPDFMVSLAIHLAAAPDREDESELLASLWPGQQNSDEQIRFALSLKAKEGKDIYYCVNDCKVSTSDAKRHDRRWERIQSSDQHINGTMKSAAMILKTGDCYDRLSTIKAWLEIASVLDHSKNDVFRQLANIGEDDRRDANDLRNAWEIVQGLVDAWRGLHWAKGAAECLLHNVNNHLEAKREKQTA